MLRQRLTPPGGRRLWALVNEMALWNPLLSRAAMTRQLRHLLTLSPPTPIQIVPARAPICEVASGPITVLRFGHDDMPDLVYLEQHDNALYPDHPRLRAEYVKQFNTLTLAAYRPSRSVEIIKGLINRT